MRSGTTGFLGIGAESECIRQTVVEVFRYAGALSGTVRPFRVRPERNKVKRAQSHTNPEIRSDGPDALYNLTEKSGPVFERASVGTVACDGAQEFVSQITVAMFDVHELVAQISRHSRGFHVIVYNGSYLRI